MYDEHQVLKVSGHICQVYLMTPDIRRFSLAVVALLAIGAGAVAAQRASSPARTPTQAPAPDWVKRSNEHTRVVLQEQARLAPEGAAQLGLDGFDDQITDLSAGLATRAQESLDRVQQELQRRLGAEKDALVRQDLEILIEAVRQQRHGFDVAQKLLLPYINAPQAIFNGLRALLDDQVPQERRRAALARLRKYAGAEAGFKPFTELAMERVRERLAQKELLGPFKDQVDRDLGNIGFFASGLDELFKKYDMPDAAPHLATLKTQFAAYEKAVRADVMPRTRTDFKLPPALYASNLEQFGVDIPPADLARMAHRAFDEIQKEMQTIAAAIGKEQGNPKADYRTVIRELKKKQLVGDAILPHYQARLKELEAIITKQSLVTLPSRPARIRIASAAESAQQPAPNMRPPRLVDNKRRAGRVRPAAEHSIRRSGEGEAVRRLHVRGGVVDADRSRSAARARAAVRGDGRARRVAGARDLRLQQHQRRGLGPLRRIHRQAVHAAGRSADLAAAPAAARRAGVQRSRAADGHAPRRRRSSSC